MPHFDVKKYKVPLYLDKDKYPIQTMLLDNTVALSYLSLERDMMKPRQKEPKLGDRNVMDLTFVAHDFRKISDAEGSIWPALFRLEKSFSKDKVLKQVRHVVNFVGIAGFTFGVVVLGTRNLELSVDAIQGKAWKLLGTHLGDVNQLLYYPIARIEFGEDGKNSIESDNEGKKFKLSSIEGSIETGLKTPADFLAPYVKASAKAEFKD